MAEFVTGITTIFGGIFSSIIDALGDVGGLVFTVGEGGTITGIAPFGLLLILGISIPLATWLFNKVFTWVKGLARSGR